MHAMIKRNSESKSTLSTAAFLSLLLSVWLGPAVPALAGETRIAVAANFTAAARELAADFEQQYGHRVRLSFGSTGKLYTQIYAGAPFDAFLAADVERPERAEREGLAVNGTRFTYALGKLALWSSQLDSGTRLTEQVAVSQLQGGAYRRLAIANPKLAPYGAAAVEAMRQLALSDIDHKLVFGENIAQTYQFVATGNAEFGFVALSQAAVQPTGRYWVVPESYYQPIRQQAVLLDRGTDSQPARAFLAYLQEERAQSIIRKHGYGVECGALSSAEACSVSGSLASLGVGRGIPTAERTVEMQVN